MKEICYGPFYEIVRFWGVTAAVLCHHLHFETQLQHPQTEIGLPVVPFVMVRLL